MDPGANGAGDPPRAGAARWKVQIPSRGNRVKYPLNSRRSPAVSPRIGGDRRAAAKGAAVKSFACEGVVPGYDAHLLRASRSEIRWLVDDRARDVRGPLIAEVKARVATSA